MMSIGFQGKSFNITVIYDYSSTTDAEEAEGDWFCEDLQHLLQLQKKKKICPFHPRGLEYKVGTEEIPRITGKFGLVA